jgi:anti-sigma B factor antagonist
MSLNIQTRDLKNVSVISLEGRITLGEAASALRDAVKGAIARGARNLVLNLQKVQYVDSAGLGELVGIYVTARNQGGEVKLSGINAKLHGLMQVTKLHTVFDVYEDETAAVAAFGASSSASA